MLQLANDALAETDISARVTPADINVVAFDKSPYGEADKDTVAAIRLLARTEGLVADPVYEGKAVRGLLSLGREGYFESNCKFLLMHLGGTPAIHAYANQYGTPTLSPFP